MEEYMNDIKWDTTAGGAAAASGIVSYLHWFTDIGNAVLVAGGLFFLGYRVYVHFIKHRKPKQ